MRSKLDDRRPEVEAMEDRTRWPEGIVPYVGDEQPNVSPTAAARLDSFAVVRKLQFMRVLMTSSQQQVSAEVLMTVEVRW